MAGIKDLAVVGAPEGGTRQAPIEGDRARTLCLTDSELAELAQLGQRCEHVFDEARDIEWAYADGALHLLQRRAITCVAAQR